MPSQIQPDATLQTILEETRFTLSRIKEEPDLPPEFATAVASWKPRVQEVIGQADALDDDEASVEAAKVAANYYLDIETQSFGDRLFLESGKDYQSPRCKAFFNGLTTSAFKRKLFSTQVSATRAWFDNNLADPVFEPYKAKIEKLTSRGEAALKREATLSGKRAALWSARQTLASWMTAQRDALHSELSNYARTHGFDRTWAETFFLKETRSAKVSVPEVPG